MLEPSALKAKEKVNINNLVDFDIYNNHIYLLSAYDRKILEYSIDGHLIEEIRLHNHGGYAIKCINDECFATTLQNGLTKICFWNRKGKMIDKYEESDYSFLAISSIKPFSTSNDSIFVNTAYNNNIYYINNDLNLIPEYTYDFGNEEFPIASIKTKAEYTSFVNRLKYVRNIGIVNMERFILYSFIRTKYYKIGLYDKRNNQSYVAKSQYYLQYPIFKLIGEVESGAIFSTEALAVKQAFHGKSEVPESVAGLKGDENPFVFILRQK